MAVILNNKKSSGGSPYAYYTVENTAQDNRTATTIDLTFKISSKLASSSSSLGTGQSMGLNAYLTLNNVEQEAVQLKSTSTSWSGTTTHTTTITFTITGLTSSQTTVSAKFRVSRTGTAEGDYTKGASLSTTTCDNITIPIGHTPPSDITYTMAESNSSLSGVANDVIAENLSVKTFTVNYTLHDSATVSKVGIYNNIYPYTTTSFTIITAGQLMFQLDCSQFNFVKSDTDPTKIPLVVRVIDSEDTQGVSSALNPGDLYSYIPYVAPYIEQTNTTAKRDGQTSGKVKLNVSGTYYNSTIGSTNQGGTYKPTIQYKFWKYEDSEPSTYANTISSSNITTSNGTFSVSNLQIGNDDESATNWFNPEKAYRIKVKVSDTFKTYELSDALSIPVGESIWDEYKDHVDFKKLTIKGQNITAPYVIYDNSSGSNDDIDLDDSASNYERLDIVFCTNDSTSYTSTAVVYEPDGKYVPLSFPLVNSNGTAVYWKTKMVYINGTSISNWGTRYTEATVSNSPSASNNNYVYITKVIGYK